MKTSIQRGLLAFVLLLIFLTACAPASTPVPATSTPAPTKTPVPTATHLPTASPTVEPTNTPDPFPDPTIKIVGEEEVVFDWSNQRCESMNIPDLPARAFRDADHQVQLILSHMDSYRMVGPDLDHLKVDCRPVMSSELNEDPAAFSDAEWLAAPYTEDGTTVYAILHNEHHGHSHPGQCPQNDYLRCWYNSLTLAVSTDGGVSYHHAAAPPEHLVAGYPLIYTAGSGPYGMMSPSNIIKGKDGYYYQFVKLAYLNSSRQWSCLMRTQDLSDPSSWRVWNGVAFEGQFVDPYKDTGVLCAPIAENEIAGPMVESVTFNTYLNRYVLVGISAFTLTREIWGFYYSFSDDLIHWTPRKLLVEMPLPWTVNNPGADLSYLYPTLIDPNSDSRNFETTGKTAYLYYTRHNHGQGNLDRDLIRVPVEFFPTRRGDRAESNGFAWEFETAGDVEGWTAWNQLVPLQVSDGYLVTESSGDDPHMIAPEFAVDAMALPRVEIKMKVSAGVAAQLFFITSSDSNYDEAKSLRFDIRGDGEFHTYSLDLSRVPGWKDIITQIRLDPTETEARIEIDYIRILPS